MLIGRKEPIARMEALLKSNKSEFLTITGRRRVGKTYLIDQMFKDHFCFTMTGIQNGDFTSQLRNFEQKFNEKSPSKIHTTPNDWQEAFSILKAYLKTLGKKSKQVIFIDELPWVATARSGFLQLLAHLWNDYLSKEKHFILVVCGSSTSWITEKIINDTGGLHNRITESIQLAPFNIDETNQFLCNKGIRLTQFELVKLYMSLGGIPYYLEKIRKGENATTVIERLCFSPDGSLKNEYDNLYKALFKNAKYHETFVSALANTPNGLTHQQIIKKTNIPDGGTYNRTKEDLLLSGFIEEQIPYGNKKKDAIYKLVDEFSIFYHKFMKPNKKYAKGLWNQLATTQSYKIWLGFAFETFCTKHITELKEALGIRAVFTQTASFRYVGKNKKDGFQIDLIIDRADNTINLCEMKFYNVPFKIDKQYGQYLEKRKQRFIEETQTKKQVFTTLITPFGVEENQYSLAYVDNEISLEQLIPA